MYKTMTVAGHEVNAICSKVGRYGEIPREATVLVGPTDRPGFRAQDGPAAVAFRKEARRAVALALGLPFKKVRAQARYSELVPRADGSIDRRDAQGKVIGTYAAR